MDRSSQRESGSIRRTRAGCWNCKERRRRCTEERPSCSGCVKRGWQCYYGMRLLWQDDAELMGIAFGRAGMKDRFQKNKKKPMVSHYLLPTCPQEIYYWLNTTSEDVRCLYKESSRTRWMPYDTKYAGITTTNNHIILPPTVSQYPSLGQSDSFLFHYFCNVCTTRRSLVNDQNPWQAVILPLCYQSQGLLQVAMAWAAHDLRNQRQGRDGLQYIDMNEMVLRHKCRSLKYLRNMVPQHTGGLQAIHLAQTQAERDALLLLIMLHCVLEIASDSIMEWTFHMRGALSIMKFYSQLRGPRRQIDVFSPQVLELVYNFFSEKDIFLATTSIEDEEFGHLRWSTEVKAMFPFLGSLSTEVHPCMGLSPQLLDIISSITRLAQRKSDPGDDGRSIHQRFIILRQRLQGLRSLPERAQPTGLINLHAAAFEEASWIYLHHAVHAVSPRHSDVTQEDRLLRLLNILGQIHARHGELLGFIPYPMWALFIASCSVSSDEDRVRILGWFTVLKRNKPISNVLSTMAAVEAIWKKTDLELGDNSLNWRVAISHLGWKMPLT